MVRILQISNPGDLNQIMQELQVDPYGIKIMLPKAVNYLVRLNSLSNIAANILKQEMLSLGGDVALPKGVLTGKIKKTDCVLIGNLSQFRRLNAKLKLQPFGLNKLAGDLSALITNYEKDKFFWDLGRYKLNLYRRPHIMGIMNITPDSFSGDGLYRASGQSSGQGLEYILDYAQGMVKDGADIIDVGGESSRPGAKPVPLKEELQRVIPVIKILAKKLKVPVSIDTYKPEVASASLDNGAVVVNDITGLNNPAMAKAVARYKSGVVIMHMKGKPFNMQKNPVYKSLIDEVIEYLNKSLDRTLSYGVNRNKIVLDPGLCFGKTVEHNLTILNRLGEFRVLGAPLLIGPSRKSFIGKILNAGMQGRVSGTVAACVLAVEKGAKILRVHDVSPVYQALRITQAVLN